METIENRLDREAALRIMASKLLITQPGKYHVRVTNDPEALAASGAVLRQIAGGTHICSIANFAAYTPYQKKQFVSLMREGRYDEAANQNLTASIRTNDYMPKKNEIIAITVDYVQVKDSTEKALLVTSYTEMPISTGSKLSMEQLLQDDVEETEHVEMQLEEADSKF